LEHALRDRLGFRRGAPDRARGAALSRGFLRARRACMGADGHVPGAGGGCIRKLLRFLKFPIYVVRGAVVKVLRGIFRNELLTGKFLENAAGAGARGIRRAAGPEEARAGGVAWRFTGKNGGLRAN